MALVRFAYHKMRREMRCWTPCHPASNSLPSEPLSASRPRVRFMFPGTLDWKVLLTVGTLGMVMFFSFGRGDPTAVPTPTPTPTLTPTPSPFQAIDEILESLPTGDIAFNTHANFNWESRQRSPSSFPSKKPSHLRNWSRVSKRLGS